tara:strand:+ start:552 stop:764 length:213 start_codon:yes stop_codon:yes gene_type:complete
MRILDNGHNEEKEDEDIYAAVVMALGPEASECKNLASSIGVFVASDISNLKDQNGKNIPVTNISVSIQKL